MVSPPHSPFRFGTRKADQSRSKEFADCETVSRMISSPSPLQVAHAIGHVSDPTFTFPTLGSRNERDTDNWQSQVVEGEKGAGS